LIVVLFHLVLLTEGAVAEGEDVEVDLDDEDREVELCKFKVDVLDLRLDNLTDR